MTKEEFREGATVRWLGANTYIYGRLETFEGKPSVRRKDGKIFDLMDLIRSESLTIVK